MFECASTPQRSGHIDSKLPEGSLTIKQNLTPALRHKEIMPLACPDTMSSRRQRDAPLPAEA